MICHSYGIWNDILPNLTCIEAIKLQKTNRFFYNIAMSRSQTKLPLGWVRFLFTDTGFEDTLSAKKIISYRHNQEPILYDLADKELTNTGWLSCQTNEDELF